MHITFTLTLLFCLLKKRAKGHLAIDENKTTHHGKPSHSEPYNPKSSSEFRRSKLKVRTCEED